MDADVPYVLDTPQGTIGAAALELDDWEQYAYLPGPIQR